MVIWAITGIIMWIRMKSQLHIGIVLIRISVLLLMGILTVYYELGY